LILSCRVRAEVILKKFIINRKPGTITQN
jgi:hypothetical protein